MTRHYSSKDFFRQMPNALLARYFQGRGLFGDLDFAAMKETKPEELFAAWLGLPDNQRNEKDMELLEIFEMSCDKGFQAIIDEANWHLRDTPDDLTSFVEMLSGLSNHYERAMITFLDHNECWRGATLNRECQAHPDRHRKTATKDSYPGTDQACNQENASRHRNRALESRPGGIHAANRGAGQRNCIGMGVLSPG
jgi:hypothetical protein